MDELERDVDSYYKHLHDHKAHGNDRNWKDRARVERELDRLAGKLERNWHDDIKDNGFMSQL